MKALSTVVFATCLAVGFSIAQSPCALASDNNSSGSTHPDNSKSPTATVPQTNPYRLPTTVVPELYNLHFTPDLRTFKFNGFAEIDVTVKAQTCTIVMNALDLKVAHAQIKPIKKVGEDSDPIASNAGTISVDEEHEQIVIRFEHPLEKGLHRLILTFNGELNDKLRGFYRSHYTNESGDKKWLATTQMEPTDARRMFPCFDEPEMKARFQIRATIDKDLTAISNGRTRSIDSSAASNAGSGTNSKTIYFEPSARMSSYLVALIIGNFKSTKTRLVDGIPVTVWALDGKENLGNYALDAACDILSYQRKYFGIKYPGKKLDLIAIPDFRSGAMENLGAITFREANLLVDEKTGSNAAKRTVFAIIAHEIAHQWFGDLVTMRWWNDIWLNEAFASWMGTKTVEAIHPEWQELTKSIETRNNSMLIDELQSTRAIHSEVRDPKQAAEMFDSITYDKGESILFMLEGYVGRAKFQKVIQNHLKAHLFDNATSEDLWTAIGKTSALPVPQLMKSWVYQPGFPILEAGTAGDGKRLKVAQKRFLGMPDLEPDSSIWQIPIVLRNLEPVSARSVQITKLLTSQTTVLEVPAGWSSVFVNGGGRGFYRSRYSRETRKTINEHFDWLTTEERLAYLSDTNALVWKGELPVREKLSLALKVATEADPIVQQKLVETCAHPNDYLNGQDKGSFEKLLKNLLLPLKNKLTWDAQACESDSVKDLRRAVLTVLGTYGQDKDTILAARALFIKYMKDRQAISADVAGAVLTIIAYNGDVKEYDQILAELKKEKTPELEKRFLNALVYFGQPELAEKTLNMVLSDEVRSQDGFRVLSGMLGRDRTKQQTWQFIKSNWDAVTKKFPPRSLSTLAYACQSLDTAEEEADVRAFFAAHDLPYARTAVARMLEDLHRKVLYRQRNQAAIRIWVAEQGGQYVSTTPNLTRTSFRLDAPE